MSQKLRDFLQTTAGKASAVGLVLVGVVWMSFQISSALGNGDAVSLSREHLFIDAETGQVFEHTIGMGETVPIEAPSGRKSGYPAELCGWTRDGAVRPDPVPVLLEQYRGESGPTFCPDCGRLVTAHNEPAVEGAQPPPTQAEYTAVVGRRK